MSTLLEARETLLQEQDVWRIEPVSFEAFIKEHLRLPRLYKRQIHFVQALLGDDPKHIFEEREVQLAVALWGKGSGKDYVCSIVMCYLIYVLLCLRDPQDYFELAPDEPLDIVNVAYSSDQAKQVFFTKLKARIGMWRWLGESFNIAEGGQRRNTWRPGRELIQINEDSIIFPRGLRAWSRHSQNESYEGLNIIAWLMDEASAFTSQAKRENAEKIYHTLRSSATSRFSLRWIGFVISYPRHADDFTCTKLREAQADPSLGIYGDGPAATWDINERVGAEPRVGVRDVEVPISMASDFNADFEDALSRYCCRPPLARDAFFRFPERVAESVVEGRRPLVEWEPVLIAREQGDGSRRHLRGVKLTHLADLPKGTKLYMHGDPGLVDDSFALAIGYATPATIMTVVPASEVLDAEALTLRGLRPEDPLEWERDVVKTVVIALLVWRPERRSGTQVDLQNVEDTIMELQRRYRTLGHWPRKRRNEPKPRPTITFDHWNSALTIQRMASKRLNVADEHWGRDFQLDIYRNARSNIYNGLVELPDTPAITSLDPLSPGALYELQRIELIDGSKIDHPEGGSKDLADAIVRVVQHATEHNTAGMGFGRAFGHKSQYSHTGPLAPSGGKKVDPTRTETIGEKFGLTQQGEDLQRTERPLGALIPSQGTINGDQMAFASVGMARPGQQPVDEATGASDRARGMAGGPIDWSAKLRR